MSATARLGDRIARLWPASALLSWGLAVLVAPRLGWGCACLLALGLGLLHRRPWRRALVALGLPLALLLQGAALPPWLWPILLLGLLWLYPRRLWRDAPLFLTPVRAFDGLQARLPLADGARLHDAGCGSGAALRAWRLAYPGLRLSGVEASRPLALWARWRCPWAEIRCGDLWAEDWAAFDLVYLFQRPESMAPALHKALAELRPGAWLISLDFELPGQTPRWTQPVGRHRLIGYCREDLSAN